MKKNNNINTYNDDIKYAVIINDNDNNNNNEHISFKKMIHVITCLKKNMHIKILKEKRNSDATKWLDKDNHIFVNTPFSQMQNWFKEKELLNINYVEKLFNNYKKNMKLF